MSAFKGFSEHQINRGEDEDCEANLSNESKFFSIPHNSGWHLTFWNFAFPDRTNASVISTLKKSALKRKSKIHQKQSGLSVQSSSDLPPEARLSEPSPVIQTVTNDSSKDESKDDDTNINDATNPDLLKGLSPEDIEKTANIEEVQIRQKKLEDENKAKRQLLAKAIADRRQRTSEETKRLHQIQSELQKMDLVVANDIRLLRKNIEEAAIDFNDAQ